jgi:hypothetical protein
MWSTTLAVDAMGFHMALQLRSRFAVALRHLVANYPIDNADELESRLDTIDYVVPDGAD